MAFGWYKLIVGIRERKYVENSILSTSLIYLLG